MTAVLAALVVAVGAGIALLIRIRRARRRSDSGLVALAGCNAVPVVVFAFDTAAGVPLVWLGTALVVPAVTVIGTIRYAPHDIGLSAHRSTSYGLFLCALIGGYAAVAAVTARFAPSVLASLAVALVALLPLRRWLDLASRREFFGVNSDATMRIRRAGPADHVLAAVVVGRWSRAELAHGRGGRTVRPAHELQATLESLVHAREVERWRLQQDLHDGVGSLIAGARMLAKGARDSGVSEATRARIVELDESLAEAAVEIRRVVDGLGPRALDRGLPAALSDQVRRYRSGGLPVELVCTGDTADLPMAVQIAVYRLVDEALTNVAKHARAGNSRVAVHRDRDAVRVAVDDDGVGGAAARPHGIGLHSMHQRCAELGGTFKISDGRPGTRLLGTIPLPQHHSRVAVGPPAGESRGRRW